MSRDRLLALLNAAPLTQDQRKRVFTDFRDAADYRDFSRRLSQTLKTPATSKLGYEISTLFKEMQPTNPDGTNMTPEQAGMSALEAQYAVVPEPPQPSMLDRALRWASVSPLVDTDAMRAQAEEERRQLEASYVQRAAQGQPASLLERAGREAMITATRNAPAELLDVVTNPAQLLARATGLGGAAATALNVQKGARAAQALSQANRAVQSGLDVAQMASGASRALTGTSPEDRMAGLAQAALGTMSLGITRRPELATTPVQEVPRVLSRPTNAQLAKASVNNLTAWQRANRAGRQKFSVTLDDWSQHAEPALAAYMAEQKIDPSTMTNSDIADAMQWYVKRLEQDFDAVSASNPDQRVTFNLQNVKNRLKERFSELPADLADAVKVVDQEFANLRAPRTLAQATALRQQLTGKLSDLFGKTGAQQYYATQSNAVKAAYDAMVDEVRDALFRTYDEMGVTTDVGASARDARRSIRTALQVRDRTQLSKELGQQKAVALPKTFGQSVVDTAARTAAGLSGFLLAGGLSNPVMGATVGYTARESIKNLVSRLRGENLTLDEIAQQIAEQVAKNVPPAGRVVAPPAKPTPPPPPPAGPVYTMTRTMTESPLTAPVVASVNRPVTPVAQELSAPPSVRPVLPEPPVLSPMPEEKLTFFGESAMESAPALTPPEGMVPATGTIDVIPPTRQLSDIDTVKAVEYLTAIAEEAKQLPNPAEAARIQQEVEQMKTRLLSEAPAPVTPPVRPLEEAPVSAPPMREEMPPPVKLPSPAPVAVPAEAPPAPVRPAAPDARASAPEQAADKVTNEIVRVIDTAGAKTGAEVQRRVIAALQEQLAEAKGRESRYVFEYDAGLMDTIKRTAVIQPSLKIRTPDMPEGEFLAAVGNDGNIIGRNSEYLSRNKQEASSFNARGYESPQKTVAKRTTSELNRLALRESAQKSAAIHAVENISGKITVQIPGDGTFTINNDPLVIEEMIRRVSKAGPASWRLSSEMKAGSMEPTGTPKTKRPSGADAPGKKVPFNVNPPTKGDASQYSGLIGEFIDVPTLPQYRFLASKTPMGWGVYEYSSGVQIKSGYPSKAKAIEAALNELQRLKVSPKDMDDSLSKFPVLNTAFPVRREE